jgi:hypothetical protein
MRTLINGVNKVEQGGRGSPKCLLSKGSGSEARET